MIKTFRVRLAAGCCAAALLAAPLSTAALAAQQATTPPPAGDSAIGPPQLRDFSLEPRQRIVTQPAPTPAAPSETPAPTNNAQPPFRPTPLPSPGQAAQRPAETAPRPAQRAPAPTPGPATSGAPAAAAPAPTVSAPAPAPTLAQPEGITPTPAVDAAPAATPEPAPAPAAAPEVPSGPPLWVYFLTIVVLGLMGYGYWLRRQAVSRRVLALTGPSSAIQRDAAPATRPAPVPRARLDVSITPERATADPDESVIEFELAVRNNGASPAQNIKLQAKLICSTPDQDKEIGAFFRKRPGEHRTLSIPPIPPGEELRMKGRVDIKRDDIRALRVNDRLIFIPMIAINAFYDWGTPRSGQTSRSFIVGREPADGSAKMAPFRLDLGPRVYRTIAQRPHKLERRV